MISDSIREELDQAREKGPLRHIQIPPCPELLAQLRRAMTQAQPDLTEVARIAASDVAMSATLLRTANSPLHLPDGMPCATVGQAMTRLGLNETAAIMMGFLVRNAIPVNNPHLARFWERSTKRAVAMAYIARQLPGLSPDLAHTFGLFCHVGMPVLLQSVRGYGGTLVEAAARIDRPFIQTENINHKTDHAVVGALLMRAWHMDPMLMCAIRLHHDFEALADGRIPSETRTLISAGMVAEHLMRQHETMTADADWTSHHAQALSWLAVDSVDIDQWADALAPLLDNA